ncbi:MAG: DUF3386 family protein [Gemmataceae bacterium]|nr:DUF3386 family protein [Gemmataceae bacterium]MDW8265050.1 DUF3386 family protein [Gemmataceae bacterium]
MLTLLVRSSTRWETLPMKVRCASVCLLVLAALPAQAHFIWIVPNTNGNQAQVLFSDTLQPDDPALLPKIAHTRWYARTVEGKTVDLKWSEKGAERWLEAPTGAAMWGGVCVYGVVQRGSGDPFLLKYCAAAPVGPPSTTNPLAAASAAWDVLPMQVVATTDDPRRFRVLFAGKPLAGSEITVFGPAVTAPVELKSDDQGHVRLPQNLVGRIGIRARFVEKSAGEHGGKKYQEVRHYSTLVLDLPGKTGAAAPRDAVEDPVATRLLAEARAARAHWTNFPGFRARIEVNLDGTLHHGLVTVEPTGKVVASGLDQAAASWARATLASVVGHRTDDSASRNTPCAFADDDLHHPLGRKVRVLNDELHSSYRIKDQQIMVVNRTTGPTRFTITVQENRTNADGKYLPASYVVHTWDAKTGALLRSDAHTQAWTRLGAFDLPTLVRVVTARPAGQAGQQELSVRSMTLTEHQLLDTK